MRKLQLAVGRKSVVKKRPQEILVENENKKVPALNCNWFMYGINDIRAYV